MAFIIIAIMATIIITSTIKSIRGIHRGSNSWSFYNLHKYFFKKMENDILLAIKHLKEVSRKKNKFAKIEQFTRKNNIGISTEELNRIIKNLVNNGFVQMKGENQNVTYNLSEQLESDDVVLLPPTQEP